MAKDPGETLCGFLEILFKSTLLLKLLPFKYQSCYQSNPDTPRDTAALFLGLTSLCLENNSREKTMVNTGLTSCVSFFYLPVLTSVLMPESSCVICFVKFIVVYKRINLIKMSLSWPRLEVYKNSFYIKNQFLFSNIFKYLLQFWLKIWLCSIIVIHTFYILKSYISKIFNVSFIPSWFCIMFRKT